MELGNNGNEERGYFASAVSRYDMNVRDMIKLAPWFRDNCLRNIALVVVGSGTDIRENVKIRIN